jgi:hypothetical protein
MQINHVIPKRNNVIRLDAKDLKSDYTMLEDIASNMVILTVAFFFLGLLEHSQVGTVSRLLTSATQAFPVVGLVALVKWDLHGKMVNTKCVKRVELRKRHQQCCNTNQNHQCIMNFLQQKI